MTVSIVLPSLKAFFQGQRVSKLISRHALRIRLAICEFSFRMEKDLTWENFVKIKTLIMAILCLGLFTGTVNAKSKKTAKKTETQSEQTQINSTQVKKQKPRMCYTYTRKWFECSY